MTAIDREDAAIEFDGICPARLAGGHEAVQVPAKRDLFRLLALASADPDPAPLPKIPPPCLMLPSRLFARDGISRGRLGQQLALPCLGARALTAEDMGRNLPRFPRLGALDRGFTLWPQPVAREQAAEGPVEKRVTDKAGQRRQPLVFKRIRQNRATVAVVPENPLVSRRDLNPLILPP